MKSCGSSCRKLRGLDCHTKGCEQNKTNMYSLWLLDGTEHHHLTEFYVWPLDSNYLCFESIGNGSNVVVELCQILRFEKIN